MPAANAVVSEAVHQRKSAGGIMRSGDTKRLGFSLTKISVSFSHHQ
jgi:hypothetical protein